MSLDFTRFKFLTFDCYGTLIDWEQGILGALQLVLHSHDKALTDDQVLALYSELESELESGNFKPYREVLGEVVRGFGNRLGFRPSEEEVQALPDSLQDWKPFPDTVAALKSLAGRYRLCVISNIDDDLFVPTAQRLEVPFHAVITALHARSYKPSLHNFNLALARTGASKDEMLHVAESLFHDIVPTRTLGIKNVWVNRRKGRGSGATRRISITPDLEVPDLSSLANLTEIAWSKS
jgi:2-haloacid dehalogenase